MKALVDQLSQYASCHRDRRNIATHFVGIPMIVVGVEALLARPSPAVALIATGGAVAFYSVLDRRFGAAMAVFLAVSLWLGSRIAAAPAVAWLVGSAVLFVGGWIVQFVGHGFEGKKPAFVDDVVGLLIGPLFLVAEVGFALGYRGDLRAEIEQRVGPTCVRKVEPSTAL